MTVATVLQTQHSKHQKASALNLSKKLSPNPAPRTDLCAGFFSARSRRHRRDKAKEFTP